MAVTKTEEIITFTYQMNDLFDLTSRRTSIMTKNMFTKDGGSLAEEYAMSDDERSTFESYFDKAIVDVYAALLKLSSGVADAYVKNETSLIIKIKNYKAFNPNVLPIVEISIKDTIVSACVREWFNIVSHTELLKQSTLDYTQYEALMRKRLVQLKKIRSK